MAKITCEALVEGGKASAGPPIGSSLGSTGVNLHQVVTQINEQTKQFEGLKVPVKIIVDPETKEFEIDVGVPPTSALLLNQLGVSKGSGDAPTTIIGDLNMDQILTVAKTKESTMTAFSLKNATLSVLGTALSMGATVEGKSPKEVITAVRNGDFDSKFK
jgi:large subunit ribosomal protein L11